MKHLIKKYRNNNLSPQDLVTLRQQLDTIDDEQLAVLLENDWQDADTNLTLADQERLDNVKQRLNSEIEKPKNKSGVFTIIKYAAVLLIPLLMGTTVFFYMKSQKSLKEQTIVTTGKGESATVSLPDGSRVTLYYESRIGYQLSSFNKTCRKVSFDGEAHFDVKSDKEHPFVIANKHLEVTVLGTVFNLSARQTETNADLYLEEGSVCLSSTFSGHSITMEPQDRAIVDYATGEITVERLVSKPLTMAQGYLTFDSTPLSKVVKTIESNFGCNVNVADKSLMTKTFSGSLPAKNINEALEVLCLSFEINVNRVGNTYTLR